MQQSLRDVYKEVTNKGPGGHILNGPVFVEEAEPGDTLEVRIQKIDLAIPYAYNAFGPTRGFLPEDFPYRKMKIIPLDEDAWSPNSRRELRFPCIRSLAAWAWRRRKSLAALTARLPAYHAGNMDNKELVAGTTLFLPVHARGALFEIGDGHAGQGNGEVDITALETSLVGTLRVHRAQRDRPEISARGNAHALHQHGLSS